MLEKDSSVSENLPEYVASLTNDILLLQASDVAIGERGEAGCEETAPRPAGGLSKNRRKELRRSAGRLDKLAAPVSQNSFDAKCFFQKILSLVD